MSQEAVVYVKCLLPSAKRDGGKRVHFLFGKEWVFRPYCEIPLDDFKAAVKFFTYYPGEFAVVEPSEYLAWKGERDAEEAAVRYCGDFGGLTKKGEFCGRHVLADGCRCEHHNEPELQGSYERGSLPRPERLK